VEKTENNPGGLKEDRRASCATKQSKEHMHHLFGLNIPEGTEMTEKYHYLSQSSFTWQGSNILWVLVVVGGGKIRDVYLSLQAKEGKT